MHLFARLFRFLLRMQGLVVLGARINALDDCVEIRVRRKRQPAPRCPRCDRKMGGRHVSRRKSWRHLDLIKTRSMLVADVREARCPKHGRMVESVPWADWQAKHTKAFDRHVASLAQVADKSAVGRMFDVAWRTVGRIVERVVDKCLPADRFDGLEAIGVDETSYKRGHRYLTVVTDLLGGKVVWVGEGKSEETLGEFFALLGPERCAKLEVVAMDMSKAFRQAVRGYAPNADIIYDRFHVVKLLLTAMDEVRREECRRLEGDARKALKHTRFALLKNPENLLPRDREKIRRARRGNTRIARAYELRVSFEQLWEHETEDGARGFLLRWTRTALLSQLPPMKRFARTVREHLDGILGFFRHWRQTSGPVEGMNNKIKLLIHRAFGFHRVPALIAMIHLCCSGIRLE